MESDISDCVGLARHLWGRWFERKFRWFIKDKMLEKDLEQTVQMGAIMAQGAGNVTEASNIIQKVYREFLSENGLSRIRFRMRQYYINREENMPGDDWLFYQAHNIFILREPPKTGSNG